MHTHLPTRYRTGPRKPITLALSLALGLATTQVLAAPDAPSPLSSDEHGPAAALMRKAAEAGIAVPRDLPYFMELAAKRRAETADASPKATITVTNCNDSGGGSLRAAVGFAASGDVVDLSGLNCNITLASSIVTSVDNLTLKGNPEKKYGISGNNQIRPFVHNGTGTLVLDGLTVRNGRVTSSSSTSPTRGGCIVSNGSVELTNQAQVKYCQALNTATSGSPVVQGGAIFAAESVILSDGGRVSGSTARSARGNAEGGGIHAPFVQMSGGLIENNTAQITGDGTVASGGGIHADSVIGKYSIVRKNKAVVAGSATALRAMGGGIRLEGENASTIKYSTLNDNAIQGSGAIFAGGAAISLASSTASGNALDLKLSTIANNQTDNSVKYGGALSLGQNAVIRSSTISGNTEKNANDEKYGAGITLDQGVTLTMTSSIIAGNHLINSTSGTSMMSDLGVREPDSGTATVVGTRNFRNWIHSGITWPTGNFGGLESVRLGSLADNGGLTQTMMPNPDSPVIDKGGIEGLSGSYDQRGEGFPRVIGTQADIGSVEWKLNPEIFADGFEQD